MSSASPGAIQVLHVDDEPGFSEMAAEFLERESDRLDVETATDATEALDRLQVNWYDCVVSDYDMPGQNGIEFLEAVRDDYPDLPFILYTGKGSEEVASEAISAGVTDYLQKESGTSQYEVLANRIINTVEKYQAQNELEVSQRRLDLFFKKSPLGVIRWDENFDLERMNEKATEILGYDESELQGSSWEEIVPESDLDAVDEVVSNLLENEGGYHSVNENIRKDGERIVCEWYNRVVTDDGEVIAIYSQFQDVSDRRERERRFEAIFNNTYTFTGLMEPDGTLLEINDTALTFGDVDREDVVGQPIWDAYWFNSHEDARETAREAVEKARDGELFRDEVRVRGADEDAIIDFSVRPIFDEAGEVTLLVPEGREITDRKEREQELQETKAELEATVTEKERLNQGFERFLEIVNDTSLSFDDRMTDVLDLGVEFLELDYGIISNIDPPEYTVEHVVTPDGSIEQGAVLDFSDTFCELVFEADGPVAFRSPEAGDVKDHPCYQDLGLEAYLGEPLIVGEERYGTLNFSSPDPREVPFTDGERAFIRTIAEWVTKEIGRNQREAEIRRLHELHHTVLSNMRETVLLTDSEGQITYVCPNVQFIFGYDDEEVADIGSVEELLDENLVDFEDLASSGEVRNIESSVTDTDGREKTVLVTVRQVDIEDGTRLYSIRDITDRKEREQELREEREFIDQALDTLDDVFYVTDPDGELRRWNDRVEEVTGYTADEIAEKNALEFFPEGEKETVMEATEEVLATGQSTVEADLLTKAGDRIPYEFRGVRLTNESGEPTGVVGIGRDVSDRKKREHALEELHAATRDLMASTTKEEVVKTGSETAESVLGLPMNGIHLYDDDEEALVPVAWTEQSEMLLDDIPPSIPIDDSLAGQAYQTGNPGLYSDVREEVETLNPETPIRSELHLPLGEHGVFMAGSTTPDDFDASDAALAQVLAANIESALDRVEREEDLARQQSLLEAQQEAVLDGMLVIDEDQQIISYNDRLVEMWDIPENIVKKCDDERAIEAAFDGLANPEEFQEKVAHLYEHPDESAKDEIQLIDGRTFDRYTTPLVGEDGTHYGRLWTFRDVTEQKERMQEVERERNRFEALFETVPDPTVHVVFEGSDPVIQHVNDAFEDVFGYGSQEARGESIDDLIVPGEKQEEATNINESVREDGLLQTEIERETVTGERPFLFTAQTMELGDAGDDRVEGVGTYVDLTEQKRRENELARQNDRLDEFASVLSHDLRNPLNVANGRLELAQEACDSDHLDAVAGALDRMEALIDDTLTLAREGDQVSAFEPVDLGELATNCWRNVDTAEATLITDTEQSILADRSRLQQVLENLFANAVEHGGEDVEITVGGLDEVSGFYVADDGPGISEDDESQVFEPGYSSSDTGTGFGLSIVKQIAEAHGWTIDIKSSEAGGARFEITGVEFAN